jgi:hypothetical protein
MFAMLSRHKRKTEHRIKNIRVHFNKWTKI